MPDDQKPKPKTTPAPATTVTTTTRTTTTQRVCGAGERVGEMPANGCPAGFPYTPSSGVSDLPFSTPSEKGAGREPFNSTQWGPIRFRPRTCTYAPWGVRVDEPAKSRKKTHPKKLPLVSESRQALLDDPGRLGQHTRGIIKAGRGWCPRFRSLTYARASCGCIVRAGGWVGNRFQIGRR